MKDDLIRRRDAINAICKACSMEEDYHKCDGYPETSTWCDELVALRALTSAESDIIRCKDCKHVQKVRSEESAKNFGQLYKCMRNVFDCPKSEDFCSRAERR